MATGAPGTNGVWQYGEDDSEATFSALLNKVASTADASIGTDRGRLTTAEGKITSLESTRPGTAGKPFATSAGIVTTNGSNQITVTFPSGRFSTRPTITAQVLGHPNVCVPYINSIDQNSFSVGAFTTGGTRVSSTLDWQAIQMTSGTAGG